MNPNQLRSLDGLAVFGGGTTTAKKVSHATVAVVNRYPIGKRISRPPTHAPDGLRARGAGRGPHRW